MNSKRLSLILVLMVLLVAGWMLSVRALSGTELKEEQASYVDEADEYSEKGLYVRSIPLYEKAIKIDTELTPEIEEKLLDDYLKYGDLNSYAKLVEKRDRLGRADDEEYIIAAGYYLEHSGRIRGMELLEAGLERLNSEKLEDFYEENRYQVSLRTTNFSSIETTHYNDVMPSFDGEKWGYIDNSGRSIITPKYDEVTRFDYESSFAVVKEDDTYYVITSDGDRYGVDDGENGNELTDVIAMSHKHVIGKRDGYYTYLDHDFNTLSQNHMYDDVIPNSCGVAVTKKDDKWRIIEDGGAAVTEYIFEDVAINSYGVAFAGDVAMVKEDGKWHMIDLTGNPVNSITFSGAKAPESDSASYTAVSNDAGVWGFADNEGNLVIDYQYSDAYSFSNGVAAVRIGTKWGYISQRNELVIDTAYSEAYPFHDGIAVVMLDGRTCLLKMDYYRE